MKPHPDFGLRDPRLGPQFKICYTKCPSGSDAGEIIFQNSIEGSTASLSVACLSPCDLPAQCQPSCNRHKELRLIASFFVLLLTPPGPYAS